MTNAHAAARRLLSARLDASLTSTEADALAAHLAGCARCRAFEQRLAAGMLGLTTLPRMPGNPAVAQAVQTGTRTNARASWLRSGLKLAGALVAFGLVGVVLVTVLRPSNGPEPQLHPGAAIGSPATQPAATAAATREHVVVPQTPSVAPEEPSASLPACDPRLLEFTSNVGAAAGTRGITIVATFPHDWQGQISPPPTNVALGGEPCRLATTVTLTLVDATGAPLDVDGNGAQAKLAGDLPAGSANAIYVWSNWCGATEGLSGLATIGDALQINVPLDALPPCNGPGQPSTLAAGAPDVTPEPSPTSSSANPPACASFDYTLFVEPAGAAGRTMLFVSARPTGALCHLTTDVTLTITDSNGAPLDIQGNGAVGHIDADLVDGAGAAFMWGNWCGERTGIQWHASADGQATAQPANAVARCGTADRPSTLEALPASSPEPTDTPAATPTEPADCDLSILEFTPDIAVTADGVELGFTAPHVDSGVICRLRASVSLTIYGSDQQALDVAGNGAWLALDMGVSGFPKDALAPKAAFLWTNWCGTDKPDSVSVLFSGGRELRFELADAPACDTPNQPSRLTPATKSIGSPVP